MPYLIHYVSYTRNEYYYFLHSLGKYYLIRDKTNLAINRSCLFIGFFKIGALSFGGVLTYTFSRVFSQLCLSSAIEQKDTADKKYD
jgi:hypothetical protein